MTITQLCEEIGLQAEIREKIYHLTSSLDFGPLERLMDDFYDYEQARNVHTKIRAIYGEDPEGWIMLTCMLYVSAASYRIYEEKGIPDRIFLDTMGCYPRFIDETQRQTGRWEFDRYWWTGRQAGSHLFRIGELEYEAKRLGGNITVGIHIPSDANLSASAVDESIHRAGQFFETYYPEVSQSDYICHSWLMDPQLKQVLGENSNILNFQNRFEVYDMGAESQDYIRWIFQTQEKNLHELAEKTSLQRNLKKFLLEGGIIYDSYGRLNMHGSAASKRQDGKSCPCP